VLEWASDRSDAAAARDQYAALLPIQERVLGAEHPDTLHSRRHLAYWTGQTTPEPGMTDSD
jgi:hypothetical protein